MSLTSHNEVNMRADSPNHSASILRLSHLAQAALIIGRATGVVYQAHDNESCTNGPWP